MHPLSQKIAELQHVLAWQRRAIAACRIGAAAIGIALLLGLVDYLVRFEDQGLRVMASTTFLAAVAWAAYRWWYLPQRERLSPLVVARRVESHFPALRDSLASAIEFLAQSEQDETAGSAQLRRIVIAEALNRAVSLPLGEIVDRRPLRKAATCLGLTLLLLAIFVSMSPRAVGTAIARLAAPLGGPPWPRQHYLEFRNVPTQLAAGQSMELELVDKAGSLPDEVTIQYGVQTASGRDVSSEPMQRVGETMVARRETVTQSFAFRATGGDDDAMAWHFVEVKPLPRLTSITLTVHPPTYTGLPITSADRQLHVISGAEIEVSGTTTEPIRAARILLDQGKPIEAIVRPDDAGHEDRAFHIDPKQWIATQSSRYRLELEATNGLTGIVGQWNLQVETDSPPSISWQRPADELYVLAKAIVPIELIVKDILAIQSVDLTYDRNDKSESERTARPREPAIALYRGPAKPAVRFGTDGVPHADSRVVAYSWDLAPLKLPAGAVLTIEAAATDYRPNIGRTIGPRQVSIITTDELEKRLADRQLQIGRQLERALAIQRKTRDEVRRVEIQLRDAGSLAQPDRLTLKTAEPNQKSVARMLVDDAEGIPPLIQAILNEIEINRLENSELTETMGRLSADLNRLSAEPLPVAERELTAARKEADGISMGKSGAINALVPLDAAQSAALTRSLTSAAAMQDEIIATLERLVTELSGKTDYRRLIRQVTEIRDDQIAHEKQSRAEIGTQSLPLAINELSPAQRATLNKAADGQTSIAARFAKAEQDMDQLAQQPIAERDTMAGSLADALQFSRQQAITAHMQQTATDLSDNRAGQALGRERQIIDDLQQLLKVLRNEGERRPEQVVDKLKHAEQKLAALQQQVANLREQIAQTERAPNKSNTGQLRKLGERQQAMKRNIEQLARELNRLQASEASQSTQSAANDLSKLSPKEQKEQANSGRPSPSSQLQKAEQKLAQAAQQLAQRRQQAEDDLQLEIVRRFQNELGEMVRRQQSVVKGTAELDAARRPAVPLLPEQEKTIAELGNQEQQLADRAKEHSELMFGLGAVRTGLEEVERRLLAANKLLGEKQTGQPTQQAEQRALSRLEAMLQTFAQTANEAAKQPDANNPPPPPPANNRQQPQRRPTFELLEVKMLRMLQADLNERTAQHEKQIADAAGNQAAQAGLAQDARELAEEQGRLAELVQNMLRRDNEKQEER
jgi:hypothetical protein